MRRMRRIECAAEQADFQAGRIGGKAEGAASGSANSVGSLPPCGGGLGRGVAYDSDQRKSYPSPGALRARPSPSIRAFTPAFDGLWGDGNTEFAERTMAAPDPCRECGI